jgi:hypothetical protein
MTRMQAIALSLLLLTGSPEETKAAHADRANFSQSHWPYLYYLSLADVPGNERADLAAVVKVVVPSMSYKTSLPA